MEFICYYPFSSLDIFFVFLIYLFVFLEKEKVEISSLVYNQNGQGTNKRQIVRPSNYYVCLQ